MDEQRVFTTGTRPRATPPENRTKLDEMERRANEGWGDIDQPAIEIDYTNYRGERSRRTITPATIFWGSNQWHPKPQWLLAAYDHEKEAERVFAVKDIHAWAASPLPEEADAKCWACRGTGKKDALLGPGDCANCGGTGRPDIAADTGCKTCKGSGNLEIAGAWHQCHECEGSGVVRADIADELPAALEGRDVWITTTPLADVGPVVPTDGEGGEDQRMRFLRIRLDHWMKRAEAAEQALAPARAEVERRKAAQLQNLDTMAEWMERIEQLTAELAASRAQVDALAGALNRWLGSGCPDCGGDCASANPPVTSCIIRETMDALAAHRPGSAKGGE